MFFDVLLLCSHFLLQLKHSGRFTSSSLIAMVVMIAQQQGREDEGSFGSTIHAEIGVKPAARHVEQGMEDLLFAPFQKIGAQAALRFVEDECAVPKISTAISHWSPEYGDGEMDEFLAFCLDGFLIDWAIPEEEIRFVRSKIRNKSTKSADDMAELTNEYTEKAKRKSRKNKGAKIGKEKALKGLEETAESQCKRSQKPKHSSKKKSIRKHTDPNGKKSSKKDKLDQKALMVDTTPETIRKASSTASSSEASFFEDGEDDNDDVHSFDDECFPVEIDEETKMVQLRLSMIQAAADAASLGRLTRLSEKVVEATSAEKVNEPIDTWKVKKSAAETDLNRSNHFQVINEAAAMGQMKRVRNKSAPNLHGWEENVVKETEEALDWQQCSSLNYTRLSRPIRRTRRSQILLSSHERMDRFVEDAVVEKKKSMYAPDQVLERQQQNDEVLSKFLSGNMDFLPTTNLPTIALPKVFLSKKRIRASLVTEVAKACAVRNHRLACNFHLNIRRTCSCPYCKAPSAIQTLAYQVLQKEDNTQQSGKPCRFNSAPRVLSNKNKTVAAVDPATLYSRTTLRRAQTEPSGFVSLRTSRHVPSWSHATLKKAETIEKTTEDSEAAPIWAMVTGLRKNDDLPAWASPALRDLVAPQPPKKASTELEEE